MNTASNYAQELLQIFSNHRHATGYSYRMGNGSYHLEKEKADKAKLALLQYIEKPMSTRASIIVTDGVDRLYFYQHSDGGTESLGAWLVPCLSA